MRYAKFFSAIIFTLSALYGAIGFYFLPLASFQSDLTRMAMLPESLFGWTKPQPAIAPELFTQSSWTEADVLVVGDSFSVDRIWQTALTQAGLHVRTTTWDSVRGICEDFMPWLHAQGFKGKYVVFESVERNIKDGLEKSVACSHMQTHENVATDAPRSPPATSFDPKRGDYSGRFSVGIKARLNIFEYEKTSHTPGFTGEIMPNGVKLARVQDGCVLFSHASCNDALFLAGDRSDDLPESVLDNIEKLNARLPGIKPIWVFVPNKSTAYFYRDKQFWNKAEQRYGAPDLLSAFGQAIDAKTVDLYPANNTHVSTTGYLLLGKTVYQSLQQHQN